MSNPGETRRRACVPLLLPRFGLLALVQTGDASQPRRVPEPVSNAQAGRHWRSRSCQLTPHRRKRPMRTTLCEAPCGVEPRGPCATPPSSGERGCLAGGRRSIRPAQAHGSAPHWRRPVVSDSRRQCELAANHAELKRAAVLAQALDIERQRLLGIGDRVLDVIALGVKDGASNSSQISQMPSIIWRSPSIPS